MSLIVKPYVTNISGRGYALSFTFDFHGELVQNQNVQGITFNGVNYQLNTASLGVAANLPPFRSLQYTQEFAAYTSATPTFESGELFISMPSAGEVVRLGNPLIYQSMLLANFGANAVIRSGLIPFPTNSPSLINFTKAQEFQGANEGVINGRLNVTLYTFNLKPWETVSTSYIAGSGV